MRRKDIELNATYILRGYPAKVVDLGPFEKTYYGAGQRLTIDGIATMARRIPDGNRVAVRQVNSDGSLAGWIEFPAVGSLKPIQTSDSDRPQL